MDNFQPQVRSPFRPDHGIALPQGRDISGVLNRLLGESAVMAQLRFDLQQAAASTANVLIAGEPGTGKRMIASLIHALRSSTDSSAVAIHCGDGVDAIHNSIEALKSLDGSQVQDGAVRPATLVLDGLGDLSRSAQIELIAGIAESSSNPRREKRSAAPRIVGVVDGDLAMAAPERVLHPQVMACFPVRLSVPALRERDNDAELLAHYFLALLNSQDNTAKSLSGDSLRFLSRYSWPGNVRELRRTVHRAFMLTEYELNLATATDDQSFKTAVAAEQILEIAVGTSLDDAERRMIVATLQKCAGNKTRAAALLGVSLKTLYNRLNAYRAKGLELSSVERVPTEVAV